LPGASVTYAVGGMATHWTACTPREHPTIERSNLLTDEEWDKFYTEAEGFLKTNQEMFEKSIRNTVVKEKLIETYPELKQEKEKPQNLPLAGERNKAVPDLITWSGGDTVLGDELINMLGTKDSKFVLKVIFIKQLQLSFLLAIAYVIGSLIVKFMHFNNKIYIFNPTEAVYIHICIQCYKFL